MLTQERPRMAHQNALRAAPPLLGCMVVLFALLVRVVYVPFHLAVEEHTESHLHALAVDPDHCHSDGHGHGHDHGHGHAHGDEHAHGGEPEHPPHSEEEHDSELLLGRTQLDPLPAAVEYLSRAEAERALAHTPICTARTERGPPLPDSVTRRVELARGPPSAV